MPGWSLNELAYAGRENLDADHVERYDAKMDASAHAEVKLLEGLGLSERPDFWKGMALSRLREILRPGGVLRLCDVVYDFTPVEAEDRIEAWCATGGHTVEGEWSRAEFEEHVRDEHSTFTWLLEPMIERCGFEIGDAQYSEDGMLAQYLL